MATTQSTTSGYTQANLTAALTNLYRPLSNMVYLAAYGTLDIVDGRVERQVTPDDAWTTVAGTANFERLVTGNDGKIYGITFDGTNSTLVRLKADGAFETVKQYNGFLRDAVVHANGEISILKDNLVGVEKLDGSISYGETFIPSTILQGALVSTIERDSQGDLWVLLDNGKLYERGKTIGVWHERGNVGAGSFTLEARGQVINVLGLEESYAIPDSGGSLTALGKSAVEFIDGLDGHSQKVTPTVPTLSLEESYRQSLEAAYSGKAQMLKEFADKFSGFRDLVGGEKTGEWTPNELSLIKEAQKFARNLMKIEREALDRNIVRMKALEAEATAAGFSPDSEPRKQLDQIKSTIKANETSIKKYEAIQGIANLALQHSDTIENGKALDIAYGTFSSVGSLAEIAFEKYYEISATTNSTKSIYSIGKALNTKTFQAEVGKAGLAKSIATIGDILDLARSIEKGKSSGWSDADILHTTSKSVAVVTDIVSLIPNLTPVATVGLVIEYALLAAAEGLKASSPADKAIAIGKALSPLLGPQYGPSVVTMIDAIKTGINADSTGDDVKTGMLSAAAYLQTIPGFGQTVGTLLAAFAAVVDLDAFDGETQVQRDSGWRNTLSNIPVVGDIADLFYDHSYTKAQKNSQSALEKVFLDMAREKGYGNFKILFGHQWGTEKTKDAGLVTYRPEGATGDKTIFAIFNTNLGGGQDFKIAEELGITNFQGALKSLKFVGTNGDDIFYTSQNPMVSLDGGKGNDTFYVGQNDAAGTRGGVDFFGGEGLDSISFQNLASSSGGVDIDITTADPFDPSNYYYTSVAVGARARIEGFEIITGSAQADIIRGDNRTDEVLVGGGGGDKLYGRGGNDVFMPSSDAASWVDGGTGMDMLMLSKVGTNPDKISNVLTLYSSEITVGARESTVAGRHVSDVYLKDVELILDSEGRDYIDASRHTSAMNFKIKNGQDFVFGTAKADTFEMLNAASGSEINGNGGDDALYLEPNSSNPLGVRFHGGGGTDKVVVGENVRDAHDNLASNDVTFVTSWTAGSTDTIQAPSSKIVLFEVEQYVAAGPSRNFVTGSSRSESISTGSGMDIIEGGGGDDFLRGGLGDDKFKFTGTAWNKDTIYDFDTGAGSEDVIQFQNNLRDFQAVLDSATQVGDDTMIAYHENSIKLVGVQRGSLHADDFAFL